MKLFHRELDKVKVKVHLEKTKPTLLILCVLPLTPKYVKSGPFKKTRRIKGMSNHLKQRFAKVCAVVWCMYCTLPLAAKYRHIILHCICLVKLIEHVLILAQTKWSSAYRTQCPIHLVSIRVLTLIRMRAFFLFYPNKVIALKVLKATHSQPPLLLKSGHAVELKNECVTGGVSKQFCDGI